MSENNNNSKKDQDIINNTLADNAGDFEKAANRNGTFENIKGFAIVAMPGVSIPKDILFRDTNKKRDKTILKDNEIGEKATFLKDAKAAGMTDKQASDELKDIDKRTSIDAFDKQKLGQNQGVKYQKDYDRHVLDVFGNHKEQQVRADALTLYNKERNNKQQLKDGDNFFRDSGVKKDDATKVDNDVNSMLGLNNLNNKNGQSTQQTLNKYSNDNQTITNQSQNQAQNQNTANTTNTNNQNSNNNDNGITYE